MRNPSTHRRANSCAYITCTECLEESSLPNPASLDEKETEVNSHAEECLKRLPATFLPWWRDNWTEDLKSKAWNERKSVNWALPIGKGIPIVQRIAAAFVSDRTRSEEIEMQNELIYIERQRARDAEDGYYPGEHLGEEL